VAVEADRARQDTVGGTTATAVARVQGRGCWRGGDVDLPHMDDRCERGVGAFVFLEDDEEVGLVEVLVGAGSRVVVFGLGGAVDEFFLVDVAEVGLEPVLVGVGELV